jgi:predicted nucleotidyltransferase
MMTGTFSIDGMGAACVDQKVDGKAEMVRATEKTDRTDQQPYSAERKKVLDQEMNRCIRLLTQHGSPEKVILFGTLAKGEVHEWSDIDLVVVERTALPFFERIKKVRKLVQPRVGMDIMVYSPDEFDELCADRSFFKEEIIGKGEVVYERGR